jgi:hypothetical protein
MLNSMESRLTDLDDARKKLQNLQSQWNAEYTALSAAQLQGENQIDTLQQELFKAQTYIGSLESEIEHLKNRNHQLVSELSIKREAKYEALERESNTATTTNNNTNNNMKQNLGFKLDEDNDNKTIIKKKQQQQSSSSLLSSNEVLYLSKKQTKDDMNMDKHILNAIKMMEKMELTKSKSTTTSSTTTATTT